MIWRDADSVGVVEVVRYFDPLLAARCKIENPSRDGGWQVFIRAKDRGISGTSGGKFSILRLVAKNGSRKRTTSITPTE